MDLEVVGADRRGEALGLSAGFRKRPGDARLTRAVEAEQTPLRYTRAREDSAHGLRLERERPQPPQLAGGAGENDGDSACGLEHKRRCGAGDPDNERTLRDRRLLAHAVLEVRVRPPQTLGDHARDALDLRLEPCVLHEPDAGRARDQLDGAVVVRGPDPA